MKSTTIVTALGLFAPALAATGATLPSIPEPGTVFYGQVINRHDGHDEVLTSGTLTWTLSDGTQTTTLTAAIDAAAGPGLYRLEIPHSLLASGLDIASGSLPLGVVPQAYRHASIAVDGAAVSIRAPGQQTFSVEEIERAATFRLDLEISRPFVDSDGDGMPDWWEDQYGLDKLVNDAALDADADGVTNLNEYLGQSNPARPNDQPQLATDPITVMADGTSAVLLQTLDSDTPPAQIVYSITTLAVPGGLTLRRPNQPDRPLAPGDTFTQADVNAGRLLYIHPVDAPLASVRVGLSVSDGTVGHTPATGEVMLRFYRPDLDGNFADLANLAAAGATIPGVAAADQLRARMYLLSRQRGWVAWEFSNRLRDASVAAQQTSLFLGGAGADHIVGSPGADVIAGGPGDDTLTGGPGADRFVITSAASGNDTITDFNPADGDVVEISGVFNGSSTDLRNFVRLTYDATGATLGLDLDGTGTSFSDMSVRLAGLTATTGGDLFTLFHGGHLVVPGLTLPAAVSVAATNPSTSENGPPPGVFTLTRLGPLEAPLAVAIAMSGSATNGTDYAQINTPVIIPAGKASVEVQLTAYADAIAEPAEIAQLSIQSGAGYVTTGTTTAQISIADLLPEITLEALEPLAVVDSSMPGMILLSRSGLVDRSVLVRLQAAGDATPVVDYQRLPSFINLTANQTTALIPVTPTAAPVLTHGDEAVHLSVTPNASYRNGTPARATVHLVPTEHSAELWQAQHAAGNQLPMEAYLAQDPGGRGIPNLLRYGFNLDPQAATADTLPKVKIDGDHLAIQFYQDHAARDLRYQVEFSTDTTTWSSEAGMVEDVTPLNATDARWSTWRAVRPITQNRAQFLRVRVEH